MSNIYIQEPPTKGKACLKTTVGDIDVEFWSKECPKACRNFIQLCMEGYYNNTIFHRVVPNFIVQGGDPTGSGLGGESIYGQPFKDEFHSRLRFVRRGLMAMANGGPNDNASQFFFTLDKTPELQNKHTIFAQVTGKTLFNMLKLGESPVDRNERPENPQRILSVEILSNPFPDIVPRVLPSKNEKSDTKKKKEITSKATKNFSLLSFGDEAEEDEKEITSDLTKKLVTKGKSAHDLANDEHLSAEPAVKRDELYKDDNVSSESEDEETINERQRVKAEVQRKLENLKQSKKQQKPAENLDEEENLSDMLLDEKSLEEKAKVDALKAEFKKLQKEIVKSKRAEKVEIEESVIVENPALASYLNEKSKYKDKIDDPKRKTTEREQKTLELLQKFQEKVRSAHQGSSEKKTKEALDDDEDEEDIKGDDWLGHTFVVAAEELRPAKDANVKTDESYELTDPRNPMNKRRREADKKSSKKRRK